MEPRMSYILACDRFATIRAVFDCLVKQTIRDRMELVLVTPSPVDMKQALPAGDEFAAIKIVEDPVVDLGIARAAGVRAASAPIVFIGETHSFSQPDLGAIILNAFTNADWVCSYPPFSTPIPREC